MRGHGGPGLARIVRQAREVAREEPWRVVGGALLVLAPFAAAEMGAHALAHAWSERPEPVPGWLLLALTPATAATVGGGALYAGLLERTVGAHHYGEPRHELGTLLRGLPLKRLIVADLLLALITAAGYAALVVAGLVIFTLFGLVGPMITIERRTVVSAFRRSAQLVAPHFLLVFTLVTLPVVVEEAIFHAILDIGIHHPGLGVFVAGGVATALTGTVVGVFEVTLAYELLRGPPNSAA